MLDIPRHLPSRLHSWSLCPSLSNFSVDRAAEQVAESFHLALKFLWQVLCIRGEKSTSCRTTNIFISTQYLVIVASHQLSASSLAACSLYLHSSSKQTWQMPVFDLCTPIVVHSIKMRSSARTHWTLLTTAITLDLTLKCSCCILSLSK